MNYRLVMAVLSLQLVVVLFVFVICLRWISYWQDPAGSAQTWQQIAWVTAAVVAIVAVLQTVIWGLHGHKRWAWYAGLTSCAICLLAPWTLPMGLFGLIGLLSQETRTQFFATSRGN